MTAAPDAYEEFFLLGITKEGGSEVQFAGMTEDITAMDWGEKEIEGIPLANGGRVVKRTPMTDESISFKVYPIDAGLTGNGGIQWFHPQSTDDSTQPLVVDNDKDRKKHKLVLLWCESLPAAASTPPDTGYPAYRIHVVNAHMTKYKPSFDGKVLSAEMTFKWTPFNKSGTANKREESCDDSAPLDAVAGTATSMT